MQNQLHPPAAPTATAPARARPQSPPPPPPPPAMSAHDPLLHVPTAAARAQLAQRTGPASSTATSSSYLRPFGSEESSVSREGELVRFSTRELNLHENRRRIFALIVVADRLEQAWLNNAIPNDVYEKQCDQLITKFKAARKAAEKNIPDMERFAVEHRLDANHGYSFGYHRLAVSGIPATKEGSTASGTNQIKLATRITAGFITLLDAIELGQNTPETLLPLTQDLQINLNRMDGSRACQDFLKKLEDWSRKLHAMPNPVAPLSEDDIKNLKLQVDLGYIAFQNHVDN